MTVVITGASAGVGRATARAFATRGAALALLTRGEDGLEAAAKDVTAAGGRALSIVCDVSDADAVERAADEAERRLGPIEVWVNNAIQGFSESLRCELLHDHSGVRVTRVDLPAVNTPQFEWVRNRLPGRPRPAGRIYQPEVAADAIVWAADHAPRELHVGITTTAVLAANRFAPGLLDRYLSRAAWDGQQTGETADPDATDNLEHPLPGDGGAHGRFDREAHATSWQLTARTAVGTAVRFLPWAR